MKKSTLEDMISTIEMIIGTATALHRKKRSSLGTLVEAVEGYLNDALVEEGRECKCELVGVQIIVQVFNRNKALVLQRTFPIPGFSPDPPVSWSSPPVAAPTLFDLEFDFS